MAFNLFCIAFLIAILTPIASVIKIIGGMASIFWGLVTLLNLSSIPNNYIWVSIGLLIIGSLPPMMALNGYLARLIAGTTKSMRQDMLIGGSFLGSLVGLLHNGSWLEFAAANDGTWLIYLNWFLCSITIFSFFNYALVANYLALKSNDMEVKKEFAVRLVSIFFWIGGFITLFAYGWIYLIAFIPLYFVFCSFAGIPQIIYAIKVRNFRKKILFVTIPAQFMIFFALVLILNLLKMNSILPFFIFAGLINGLATPRIMLEEEINDFPTSLNQKVTRDR